MARLVLSLAVAATVFAPPASALPQPAPAMQLTLDFARRVAGAPGAAAAVMQCGAAVWTGASGSTERDGGRAVTPQTRFVTASTAKTMVAAMVLSLVGAGRLSLGQSIDAYYPQLPNASAITVRRLLDHSSGLGEYYDDPAFERTIRAEPFHAWTRDEVLGLVRGPQFAPGAAHEYTNTNFVVLGGIIEQVTGRPIQEALASLVAPLGLSATTFRYDPSRSGEFAHSYENGEDQFSNGMIRSDVWGEVWTDGGLASTAPEFASFGDALFRGALLGASGLEAMTAGAAQNRGLGVFAQNAGGSRWLGHDGSYGGFESELWHDSSRGLTLVVFSNEEDTAARIWSLMAESPSVRLLRACA